MTMHTAPDLLTLQDIADMLTLNRDYVRDRITKRPDFPRRASAYQQARGIVG